MIKEYGPFNERGEASDFDVFCDICGEDMKYDFELGDYLSDYQIQGIFNFGSACHVSDFIGFEQCCKKCRARVSTFLIPLSDIYLLRRYVNKLQKCILERKRNANKNDNRATS